MRYRNILTIACWLVVAMSCDFKRGQKQPTSDAPTPKALENNYSRELSSWAVSGDLVEQLYQELASKRPALGKWEKDLAFLRDNKLDSQSTFRDFEGKNESYLTSAASLAAAVKDSALRKRLTDLVNLLAANHRGMVAPHNKSLGAIREQEATLSDLHRAIKLLVTIPVMEDYMKQHLPSTKPLVNYQRLQQNALATADSIMKK